MTRLAAELVDVAEGQGRGEAFAKCKPKVSQTGVIFMARQFPDYIGFSLSCFFTCVIRAVIPKFLACGTGNSEAQPWVYAKSVLKL